MDETQLQTGRAGTEMMSDDALDAQIGYNLKRARLSRSMISRSNWPMRHSAR
ncbi:hypothetical protein ACVDG5_014035 [Mesorhizobium sp. ORM6]